MKKLITTLLLILIATPAFAAKRAATMDSYSDNSSMQPKAYIGLSAGSGTTDIPNVTTSASVMSLFGGYAFHKNLAAEASYIKFGDLDISGTMVNGSATSLSLVPMLNLGQSAALFAKVGFASVDLGTSSTRTTTSGLSYGIGAQFNLGKRMNLRISYDNYGFKDSSENAYNYKVPSVGVMFRF